MRASDFTALRSLLSSPEALVLEVEAHDAYHHDATDFRGRPAAIVFAAGEADVVAAVRFCAERGLPLVGRGAGTGLSGGCVPAN
ncbi:MAG TPA: FAD-binding protein, partial [candidate division Zixibacteria bacterium]|nr:FAD-binding protein [candidate division Zixibacteria bacterium]